MKLRFVLGIVLLAAAQAASAQDWPSRPLRWIVPQQAGGGADLIARLIAPRLSERLGQPVIVDNRPGAATNIGMELAAKATPDGHTVLTAVTPLVINPHLYKMSFDPLKDLVPVIHLASAHFVLLASPALPVKTVPEVVALAKAKSSPITCAHAAGSYHIACAWLGIRSRADITLIPYKSSPQATNDVIGGRVDLVFDSIHLAVPHVKANRLAALATTNPRRGSGPLGNLPVMAETFPGFELASLQGVMAPAGTPRAVIERLNREIAAVLEAEDLRKTITNSGVEVIHGSPAAFARIIRRDYARYGKIIREAGISAK